MSQIINAVENVSHMVFCTGMVRKGEHKRTTTYMEHISGNGDQRIPIVLPSFNIEHHSRFCLGGCSDMILRHVKQGVKEIILDPETTKVENIIVNNRGRKNIP